MSHLKIINLPSPLRMGFSNQSIKSSLQTWQTGLFVVAVAVVGLGDLMMYPVLTPCQSSQNSIVFHHSPAGLHLGVPGIIPLLLRLRYHRLALFAMKIWMLLILIFSRVPVDSVCACSATRGYLSTMGDVRVAETDIMLQTQVEKRQLWGCLVPVVWGWKLRKGHSHLFLLCCATAHHSFV